MSERGVTKTNIIDRLIITFFPLVAGIVVGIIVNYIVNKTGYILCSEDGMELIKSIVDILGILLGFIITAVSILLTIGENSYINRLVEANHMQNIIFSYVMSSIYLFTAIIFAVVLLVIEIWNNLIFDIFIGVNVVIAISVAICIYFLFAIVSEMNK